MAVVSPGTIEWLRATRRDLTARIKSAEANLENSMAQIDQARRALDADKRLAADIDTLLNIAPRA